MLDAIEKHQSIKGSVVDNSYILDLLIFSAIALILLWINWTLINVNLHEVGDFAANSLLIQKAKSLNLFVGNYSRVGFNHPGPAILYVLAAGELLFFDWTRILSSPFSGQLVAVILYNAAWITIFFRMLRKILGSTHDAGFVTAAFLCIVAYQNFQFFAGMWFPELYFFPFAVMLVSASRFASGKTDMLMPLILSTGFLINGHVSFVSTLGVIFVLLVLYNHLVHDKLERSQYIFGREYWKKNAWTVAPAIFVLFLFFVPLIVETIRHFPGPAADYIAFGKQHHANTLGESIEYAGQFWGHVVIFGSATLIMVTLLARGIFAKRHTISDGILALLATLLSATVAMLIYSKFGVDQLDQRYIGYFYYSVPALAASLVGARVVRASTPGFFAFLSIIAIPALLIITVKKVDNTPDYANSYNQPDVVNLYKSLEQVKQKGRIVLNLDSDSNWGDIWSKTAGLAIYAKRHNNELICIRKNWHILFTKDEKCTPDEIANNQQYEVSSLSTGNRAPTDIEGAGLLLRKYPDDLSGLGFVSVDKTPDIFDSVLNDGWSSVESEFVWMQSNEAHLTLKVRKGFSGTLQLDLGAFLPRPSYAQHLSIYVNDGPAYRTIFDASAPRQMIRIPLGTVNGDRLDVKFVDPDIVSPKTAGLSGDPRTLGISLYGFGLTH